VICLWGF